MLPKTLEIPQVNTCRSRLHGCWNRSLALISREGFYTETAFKTSANMLGQNTLPLDTGFEFSKKLKLSMQLLANVVLAGTIRPAN